MSEQKREPERRDHILGRVVDGLKTGRDHCLRILAPRVVPRFVNADTGKPVQNVNMYLEPLDPPPPKEEAPKRTLLVGEDGRSKHDPKKPAEVAAVELILGMRYKVHWRYSPITNADLIPDEHFQEVCAREVMLVRPQIRRGKISAFLYDRLTEKVEEVDHVVDEEDAKLLWSDFELVHSNRELANDDRRQALEAWLRQEFPDYDDEDEDEDHKPSTDKTASPTEPEEEDEPLKRVDYTIRGMGRLKPYEGTTDDRGYLEHTPVAMGIYIVTLADGRSVTVASVHAKGDPLHVQVPRPPKPGEVVEGEDEEEEKEREPREYVALPLGKPVTRETLDGWNPPRVPLLISSPSPTREALHGTNDEGEPYDYRDQLASGEAK